MPGRPKIGNRLARYAPLLAALLGGCDGEVLVLDANGQLANGRCFSDMLYLVEGDVFTFLSGGLQTFDSSGGGVNSPPTGWNPELEPRAKCQLQLKKSRGTAQLLWDDVVVSSAPLDEAFLASGEVTILSYRDPDGTRVEFHVYAHSCGTSGFPRPVATRAEIEALEGR